MRPRQQEGAKRQAGRQSGSQAGSWWISQNAAAVFDSPGFHPLAPDSAGRLGVFQGLSEGVACCLVCGSLWELSGEKVLEKLEKPTVTHCSTHCTGQYLNKRLILKKCPQQRAAGVCCADEAGAAVEVHATTAVYRVSINNASPSHTCKPPVVVHPSSFPINQLKL